MNFNSENDLAAFLRRNPNRLKLVIEECQALQLPPLPETLQVLVVFKCQKLTQIPALPSTLTKLVIWQCPSLALLPSLPCKLTHLSIAGCHALTGEVPLPGSLVSLQVNDCLDFKLTLGNLRIGCWEIVVTHRHVVLRRLLHKNFQSKIKISSFLEKEKNGKI